MYINILERFREHDLGHLVVILNHLTRIEQGNRGNKEEEIINRFSAFSSPKDLSLCFLTHEVSLGPPRH